MVIELSNGQLKFWQWDTEQKVKVPENVPTVHFKFGSSAVELPVADRWVKVPNELLQTGKDILLWTYKEDHTLDAARIPVERRPKPDGYAYTPTEIKTWEQLDKRIKALEAANVQPDWNQNDPEGKGYIANRPFYTEKPPIITNLGNTYDIWDKICTQNGAFSNRNDVEKAALSFIIEGNLYKNIVPRFFSSAYVYNYVAGEYEVTVYENNYQIKCFAAGKEVTNWQIVSISDKEKVHHLDQKYLDPKLLERIKALEDGGGVAGVSSINGQTGAVEITAKGLGALTEDDLQSATNKALAQAKASGEFDGAQGPKGDPGAAGPTGPAGAGLDVTGATVGQTVKISAVDANGVPTAWVPVDMASGGGAKGEPTLIAQIDFEQNSVHVITQSELANLTELIFISLGVKSTATIQSYYALYINDQRICANLVPIQVSSSSDSWNFAGTVRYNGIFWEPRLQNTHAGADPTGSASAYISSSQSGILGVGPATKITLMVPNQLYKAVAGTLSIYGR
jgi:hypothetical protein